MTKLAPGGGGGGCWIGGKDRARGQAWQPAEQNSRRDADQRSNVTGAAKKPEWATGTGTENMATGTSIFDPVLAEMVYRWFCPPGGIILDPFAGGSVRGIVASKLGYQYIGIDLRPEQLLANQDQAAHICIGDPRPPVWFEGDSLDIVELTNRTAVDFVFSCPPYADLEQYSDDPRDISNMEYPQFCEVYRAIVAASTSLLKPDRFACFVVGDVRDDDGFYRGFPELTVASFESVGLRKYNEAILVTSVGSLPIRIGKQFGSARKLGKTHQNVLVFVKGDPKRAGEACNGQLELPEV